MTDPSSQPEVGELPPNPPEPDPEPDDQEYRHFAPDDYPM